MAFTYDSTLATDRDWIRLQIADTVENDGPRIANRNYSDEEIAALLAKAKNNPDVVVAQVFAILAAEWSKFAISYQIGPRREDLTKLAERYQRKAEEWAIIAGIASTTFSSGLYRAGSRETSEHN